MGSEAKRLQGLGMINTLSRDIGGFLLACLAAGLVKVLFVFTPAQLAVSSAADFPARISDVLLLSLLAATHSTIFAAAFALIAVSIGEWLTVRSPAYYALSGMAIALLGFFAQYSSEVAGQPSIFNGYALTAFMTAGLAAGLTYWLAAGKYAGRRRGYGFDAGEKARTRETPRILVDVKDAAAKKIGWRPGRREEAEVEVKNKKDKTDTQDTDALKTEASTSVSTTKPAPSPVNAPKPGPSQKT